MTDSIPIYPRWAATREGTENFIGLVLGLHHGVIDKCPGCGGMAKVVPLDPPRSYAAYECECGASWVKRCKFVHRLVASTKGGA